MLKKYVGYMIAFVFGTYLWFALLPTWLNFSFPTGGWDWLGFVGVVGGFFLSVWCLKKQQELSVVPCLDVDAYSTLGNNAANKVFRKFNDTDGRIYNDGYMILRTSGKPESDESSKREPDGFNKSANIKVTNKGLSTAFQVCVYLYDLKSVDGLTSLDEIATTPIDDFYDKIHYGRYTYYEKSGANAEPVKNETDWLISPQYNLGANAGEFNLVFDFSEATQEYHSILKFEFEDIYQKKYYQLLYLYFDKKECASLPISKLYCSARRDKFSSKGKFNSQKDFTAASDKSSS